MLAAVNRDLAQVQANDPVVAGEGFVAKRCEDSGCGPFVATATQGGLSRAADPAGDVPRTARDQPSQDPLETHPVGDPTAMTAQRVRFGPMHGDQRAHGPPR